jgi:hypothetical protein
MNMLRLKKKVDKLKKAVNPFTVIFWIFASVIVALVLVVLRRNKSLR